MLLLVSQSLVSILHNHLFTCLQSWYWSSSLPALCFDRQIHRTHGKLPLKRRHHYSTTTTARISIAADPVKKKHRCRWNRASPIYSPSALFRAFDGCTSFWVVVGSCACARAGGGGRTRARAGSGGRARLRATASADEPARGRAPPSPAPRSAPPSRLPGARVAVPLLPRRVGPGGGPGGGRGHGRTRPRARPEASGRRRRRPRRTRRPPRPRAEEAQA